MAGSRCFSKIAPEDGGPPLLQHGTVVFQAHYVGWIVTAFFTAVATVTSFWLINKHLQWYTNKREQRYIVRILLMVPIYATISLASFLFWNHHTPLLLIRDCYESTALTAFFYLLLTYLSPDPDQQRTIFLKVGLSRQANRDARRRGEAERKWIFPLSFVEWKPEDGLYFLQVMKWGVLQYCVIRPSTTLAAVILNYIGLYCEDSWSPQWGHPYITIVVSISVSVAMYCLIQLYVSTATCLAPHKPLLKLFSIKAIVFLTFWQATLLGLLVTFKVIKDTQYMTADDIVTGFSAIIETFEMMIFAFIHVKAFSYRPYRSILHSKSISRTPRLRSLGHAFDFRETFREIGAGIIYVFDQWRGHEPRPDRGARRALYLEGAFGKPRPSLSARGKGNSRRENGRVEVEVAERVDVDVGGERQWLGLGDNYIYGLGYARREKSDGLEQQIMKELQRRGFDSGTLYREPRAEHVVEQVPEHKAQSSWWRGIYRFISQSGAENEGLIPSKRKSGSQQPSREVDQRSLLFGYEYDEPPPPSRLHTYRNQRSNNSSDVQPQKPLANIQEHPPAGASDSNIHTFPLELPTIDHGQGHFTSKPLPSPPRFSSPPLHIDNAFALSITDHDTTSESGIRSPISPSIPFDGLVFSQPQPAKTAVIVSSGQYHESEAGHMQADGHIVSHPPEDPVTSQPSTPPVPPKAVGGGISEEPLPRRSSHRRESAFHNSPPFFPSPPTFDSKSIIDTGIPNTPPGTYYRDLNTISPPKEPSQLPPPQQPDLRPTTSVIPTNPLSPRHNAPLIHTSVLAQPRQQSLPVPAPSASYNTGRHLNAPHSAGGANRRMSAPLGAIPQYAEMRPTNPPNQTSTHRSRYSVGYTDNMKTMTQLASSSVETRKSTSRYLIPNSQPPPRRPRRSSAHLPRVAVVMPPLLASSPSQTAESEIRRPSHRVHGRVPEPPGGIDLNSRQNSPPSVLGKRRES